MSERKRVPGFRTPRDVRAAWLSAVMASTAIGFGPAAWADCQPDPPAPGGTVTCTGTDTGGFQHPEIGNLTVNVEPGATVTTGANTLTSAILAGDDSAISNGGTVATNGDQAAGLVLWRGGTVESSGIVTIGGTNSAGLYAGLDLFLNGGNPNSFSATVRNSGQITTSGAGSAGLLTLIGGTLENSGSLQILGTDSAGLSNRGVASATNSGTITVSGPLASGIYNVSGTSVLNTGTIETLGDDDLGIDNLSAGISVTNKGNITSSGQRAAGMYGQSGSLMSNSGTIGSTGNASSGVTLATSSSLTNSGTISASGATGIGIYGTNFNPFNTSAPGGPTYETVTNEQDANIEGTTVGVGFAQIFASAPPSLQASSHIAVAATANRVDNSGFIFQSGGTGGAGILAITEAVVPNSNQVLLSDGGGTEIVNSGDITALGTGISFTSVPDYPLLLQAFGFEAAQGTLVPTQDNIVTNTGTITGGFNPVLTIAAAEPQNPVAIQGGAAREFVTNKGTLNGDVRLGGGSDTLTLFTQSSNNGDLDGGTGTDSLVLDGTGTGAQTGFFGSTIANFETLTKQGAGDWTLSTPTPPSFTGVTVAEGKLGIGGFNSVDVTIAPGASLVFDGPVHTTGTVTVNGTLASEGGDPLHIDGGTLKGNSTIEAPVILGDSAIVAPGNSPGTLTINGDFTMGPGNTLQIEIDSLSNFDVLKVLGVATLDGTLETLTNDVFAHGGVHVGDTFDVVTANSIADGLDALTSSVVGLTFSKQVIASGGGEILRLTVTGVPAVPVPPALPLMGSALAALALVRRKRAAKA